MGFHIEIELQPRLEKIRRCVIVQSLGPQAGEAVQVLQYAGRKAPAQGLPGQGQHLADPLKAHACKGRGHLGGQPRPVDRQLPHRLTGLPGIGHGQAIVHIGQHPRRHRVAGQHNAMLKTQRRQLLAQARLEARPRPEQRQARLDFQQQHARVMQADLRAEAIGPGRQKPLPLLHRRRVVLHALKIPRQRLGCRQRLPRAQPQRPRRRVDRLQHPALGRATEQGQRRIGVVATAQNTVERQLWQHDTRPQHGNLTTTRRAESARCGRE
ncbi:hypothetical protein D9M71_171320 [compost metagenome]